MRTCDTFALVSGLLLLCINVFKFIASDHLLAIEDCTAQEWRQLLSIMIFISFGLPDHEAVPLHSVYHNDHTNMHSYEQGIKGLFLSILTSIFLFLWAFW